MELLEIIKIFKSKRKIFFTTLSLFIFLGVIGFFLQPNDYLAELSLNVSRKGVQKTEQYRYDDFYRLQADERFADTVVRWLDSPSILAEIDSDSSGAKIIGKIKALRLSSQMIQVSFKISEKESGEKIASSILKILNKQSEKLNKQQQEETWFMILGDDAIVHSAKISFAKAILGAFLVGIFLAFWMVLLTHYFEKNKR
jgi:capsular polysaccharide biosynthesis protein